jgi:dihydroorotase
MPKKRACRLTILVPLAAIRAGKGYLTEQGSAEHAFDL